MHNISRRRFLALGVSAAVGAARPGAATGTACSGTTSAPDALYDPNIRTVFVPTFNNRAFQTEPYRGFEVDVTQAVIREIGRTTAFVGSPPTSGRRTPSCKATSVAILKTIQNLNQQNQCARRAGGVGGRGVARPAGRHHPVEPAEGAAAGAEPAARRPARPVRPGRAGAAGPHPARPADAGRIVATGRLIPELGESNASASKRVHDQLAVQIVSMMERKW
jgi:hypothetical protein